MIRFLSTLLLAAAGGALFSLIHCPLPWLLGPMTFAFLGTRAFKLVKPVWPGATRNIAMLLIGYSFGLSLTSAALSEMGKQLPAMVLMTVLLMLMCGCIAFLLSKLTGEPLPTMLMGCVPGGLSQMLLLAEDTKGINLTTVMFMQLSRTVLNLLAVPLLIFSPVFGGLHSSVATGSAGGAWGDLLHHGALFAVACVGAALLAQKVRMPTAYLLGPMIATAALHLSGVHGPSLPHPLLNIAQLLIGTYVGLLIKPDQLKNKTRTIGLAILSGCTIIAGSLGLSTVLTQLHAISAATSFLSLAPGGLDQMGLVAREVHADLAIVSCYQLFRIWFIYLAVTPIMRAVLKRRTRSASAEKALHGA